MRKALALLIPALTLAVAPLSAGEEEHRKRCSAEASACIRDMAAALSKRGWIGIEWQDDSGPPTLTHVVAGSPAEIAGLRVGDAMVAFNGVATEQGEEAVYAEVKRSLVPGNTITLTVARGGERLEVEVELIPVPEHIVAQWIGRHMLEHHAAAPEETAETAESRP